MAMKTIELRFPDELVELLSQGDQPLDQAAQELIVLELYRRGIVSSGKAAELLEMERFEFVRRASGFGIPFFDMTPDEWAAEREASERL